jgi:hypothetical protein
MRDRSRYTVQAATRTADKRLPHILPRPAHEKHSGTMLVALSNEPHGSPQALAARSQHLLTQAEPHVIQPQQF